MSCRIIDLSMPVIADHFRWPTSLEFTGDYAREKPFRTTRINLSCHAFTHVDARRHMLPDGETIEMTAPADVAGPAFVADLSMTADDTEISAEQMHDALKGRQDEKILLVKTTWGERRDWRTPAYWRQSPWLSRGACDVIASHAPTAVAFDFPQDHATRLSLDGISLPMEDNVSHDTLLRAGITLVEYLVGTSAIVGTRTFLCALPIKIDGADGAPARVVAIEDGFSS